MMSASIIVRHDVGLEESIKNFETTETSAVECLQLEQHVTVTPPPPSISPIAVLTPQQMLAQSQSSLEMPQLQSEGEISHQEVVAKRKKVDLNISQKKVSQIPTPEPLFDITEKNGWHPFNVDLTFLNDLHSYFPSTYKITPRFIKFTALPSDNYELPELSEVELTEIRNLKSKMRKSHHKDPTFFNKCLGKKHREPKVISSSKLELQRNKADFKAKLSKHQVYSRDPSISQKLLADKLIKECSVSTSLKHNPTSITRDPNGTNNISKLNETSVSSKNARHKSSGKIRLLSDSSNNYSSGSEAERTVLHLSTMPKLDKKKSKKTASPLQSSTVRKVGQAKHKSALVSSGNPPITSNDHLSYDFLEDCQIFEKPKLVSKTLPLSDTLSDSFDFLSDVNKECSSANIVKQANANQRELDYLCGNGIETFRNAKRKCHSGRYPRTFLYPPSIVAYAIQHKLLYKFGNIQHRQNFINLNMVYSDFKKYYPGIVKKSSKKHASKKKSLSSTSKQRSTLTSKKSGLLLVTKNNISQHSSCNIKLKNSVKPSESKCHEPTTLSSKLELKESTTEPMSLVPKLSKIQTKSSRDFCASISSHAAEYSSKHCTSIEPARLSSKNCKPIVPTVHSSQSCKSIAAGTKVSSQLGVPVVATEHTSQHCKSNVATAERSSQSCKPITATKHPSQLCEPIATATQSFQPCKPIIAATNQSSQPCKPIVEVTKHSSQTCNPIEATEHSSQTCNPIATAVQTSQTCKSIATVVQFSKPSLIATNQSSQPCKLIATAAHSSQLCKPIVATVHSSQHCIPIESSLAPSHVQQSKARSYNVPNHIPENSVYLVPTSRSTETKPVEFYAAKPLNLPHASSQYVSHSPAITSQPTLAKAVTQVPVNLASSVDSSPLLSEDCDVPTITQTISKLQNTATISTHAVSIAPKPVRNIPVAHIPALPSTNDIPAIHTPQIHPRPEYSTTVPFVYHESAFSLGEYNLLKNVEQSTREKENKRSPENDTSLPLKKRKQATLQAEPEIILRESSTILNSYPSTLMISIAEFVNDIEKKCKEPNRMSIGNAESSLVHLNSTFHSNRRPSTQSTSLLVGSDGILQSPDLAPKQTPIGNRFFSTVTCTRPASVSKPAFPLAGRKNCQSNDEPDCTQRQRFDRPPYADSQMRIALQYKKQNEMRTASYRQTYKNSHVDEQGISVDIDGSRWNVGHIWQGRVQKYRHQSAQRYFLPEMDFEVITGGRG